MTRRAFSREFKQEALEKRGVGTAQASRDLERHAILQQPVDPRRRAGGGDPCEPSAIGPNL